MAKAYRLIMVVLVALASGAAVGYLAGREDYTGEHSCPANGPCPDPPHPPFSWHSATVAGVIAFALVVVVAAVVVVRRRGEPPH